MANSNGRKGLIYGLSLAVALLGGAVAGGAYMGGQSATIESHLDNPAIHETATVKEARVRRVVDREVMPLLERMQTQLDRIERKIDGEE